MSNIWNPLAALDRQRGALLPWCPVAMGAGVGFYFQIRFEPELGHYFGLILAVALPLFFIPKESVFRIISIGLCFCVLGFCLAGLRAHTVKAPILDFRFYGAIEGRIIAIDRSHSDKVRLTLDRVHLDGVAPKETPKKIRVSLHGAQRWIDPEPGLTIALTGHLSPPQGPVEPGGFDFRRMAFFRGLGAVGYTRTPVLVAKPVTDGWALIIHRTRAKISALVQAQMPGRAGAFAAAVTTGDRSAMGQDTLEDLRSSNLAHLLAISGLHMGLLTGFLFASIRLGIALIPPIALRVSSKKLAAAMSLTAGFLYYLLSGGNVATERAFIMVSVMFAAVLLDRRAITLRAVAIAAMIVLVFRPETLAEPGFQMSFAATTALVAVFAALRDWEAWSPPKWAAPVLALVISSAVAGLATAPISAAHFNKVAEYGLLANLLAVPVMGTIVMPGAVLAACLSPIGAEWVGLWLMGFGIDWILWVANWVASMEGSVFPVVAAPSWTIPTLTLGALFLFLWQGRARVLGAAPMLVALMFWGQGERPPILISESGKLVGLMTEHGRSLSKPRGDGFTAKVWLENDGDFAAQEEAANRLGIKKVDGYSQLVLDGHSIVHLSGKKVADKLADACLIADLVVTSESRPVPDTCNILSLKQLENLGAVALFPGKAGPRIIGANELIGDRLWIRK